jgi:hypothetical protein
MVTVTINGESREINDTTENWITQTITAARKGGRNVCVQVAINLSALNMTLSTPGCGGAGGGGGRAPNANEREVFDLWEQRALNRSDFGPGALIAFLRQFRRLAAA